MSTQTLCSEQAGIATHGPLDYLPSALLCDDPFELPPLDSPLWDTLSYVHNSETTCKRVESEKPRAHIRTAIGGNYSEIEFVTSQFKPKPSKRPSPTPQRGKIRSLTRKSRKGLLDQLNKIPKHRYERGGTFFVTLSYPSSWPSSEVRARDFETFLDRLRRRYEKCSIVWRLGFQRRGAPHYHCLIFLPTSSKHHERTLVELRHFVSRIWYRIAGEGKIDHRTRGTNVSSLKSSPGGGLNAAARYLAKAGDYDPPEGELPGRFWGVRGRENLGIAFKATEVSLKEAFYLRRVFRRKAGTKSYSRLNRTNCYISEADIDRLLEFLRSEDDHPYPREGAIHVITSTRESKE